MDVLLISPSFTFVIFTGFVPSLSDTLIFPPEVAENFGPSSPICTVLKEGFSTVANVILPFLLCVTSRFLPAIISIVLPALMSSPVAFAVLFAFSVPPSALAFNVKAALFTAFTTESTVAILPASPSVTFTVPRLVPVVTGSISPVTTVNPLSSVVIVVPSVLTLTPFLFTSNDLSAGFTVILLSLVLSKPLPKLTLYFTVDVVLSVSTTAVVPLPSSKFTVSYGFTKSLSSLLFCKFQPACNTSPTVAALFLIVLALLGAVALVVGSALFGLAPSRLPATLAITLPPLFKPFFVTDTGFLPLATGVIVTPSPLIVVISPAVFLNSALVKPASSFDNLKRILLVSPYVTPILFSDNFSLSAPPSKFKRLSAILLATTFFLRASALFAAASTPSILPAVESSAP